MPSLLFLSGTTVLAYSQKYKRLVSVTFYKESRADY